MDSLSKGFCDSLLSAALSDAAMEAYRQEWPRPVVQVVDLQRYPKAVSERPSGEPSRFYALVSDSVSVLWLVVPPETEMEEMFASFQIDLGCCITLDAYTVVTAPNGYNVLVLLQVSFSANPLSLIGRPAVDPALFTPSPRALTSRALPPQRGPPTVNAGAADTPLADAITLHDLVDHPERATRPWSIVLRIVYKGHAFPVNRKQFRSEREANHGAGGGNASSTHRVVQRCVGVDANGTAITCVFWRSVRSLLSTTTTSDGWAGTQEEAESPSVGDEDGFSRSDCILLHRGSVNWCAGETLAPSELTFSDHSVARVYASAELPIPIPEHPHRLSGALSDHLKGIADILHGTALDEMVSVIGIVRSVDHGVQVNTKRGRVLRVIVSLVEETNSCACIDVTFWGELAERLGMGVGELWLVSNCGVREFMQRKTLSARASSIVLRMRAASTSGQSPARYNHDESSGRGERCSEQSVSQPIVSQTDKSSCVAGSSAARGSGDVEANDVGEESAKPTMQLVVSFAEASPTLPVLARIQEIKGPLTHLQCSRCRAWATLSAAHSSTPLEERGAARTLCSACGAKACGPVFAFYCILSDGLESEQVFCINSVGETLTGMSANTLMHAAEENQTLERGIVESLIGAPVLVWLVRGAAREHRVPIACKFVNMRLGAAVLLSAIDSILAGE